MSDWELIPVTEVDRIVSVDDMKEFLRVSHDSHDDLIGTLIDGCQSWIESVCGIKLAESSYAGYMDGGGVSLWPEFRPVISITSVTDSETGTAESTDNYHLRFDSQVVHDGESRWSDGRGRWLVSYTAGYGGTGDDSVDIPNGLKVALMHLVRRAYDARGGAGSESASGWSVTWEALMTGDIGLLLQPYMGMTL